jgi:hypothetical protein
MASTSSPKARAWVQPLRILLVAVLTQLAGSEAIRNAAVRWPVVGAAIALAEVLASGLSVRVTSEPVAPSWPPGTEPS